MHTTTTRVCASQPAPANTCTHVNIHTHTHTGTIVHARTRKMHRRALWLHRYTNTRVRVEDIAPSYLERACARAQNKNSRSCGGISHTCVHACTQAAEWNNILSELHTRTEMGTHSGWGLRRERTRDQQLKCVCVCVCYQEGRPWRWCSDNKGNGGCSEFDERVDWTQTLIRTN